LLDKNILHHSSMFMYIGAVVSVIAKGVIIGGIIGVKL
jgi:hypothetical protein